MKVEDLHNLIDWKQVEKLQEINAKLFSGLKKCHQADIGYHNGFYYLDLTTTIYKSRIDNALREAIRGDWYFEEVVLFEESGLQNYLKAVSETEEAKEKLVIDQSRIQEINEKVKADLGFGFDRIYTIGKNMVMVKHFDGIVLVVWIWFF